MLLLFYGAQTAGRINSNSVSNTICSLSYVYVKDPKYICMALVQSQVQIV